jgi:hypothetical protein
MLFFHSSFFLAAATLALAAPLRLRDVNVAIPFDPVSGDDCNLNLDGGALALKVSPQVLEYVSRVCAFASCANHSYQSTRPLEPLLLSDQR